MNKIARIGLNLAKNVFQIHALDRDEKVVIRKTIHRQDVLSFFAKLDAVDEGASISSPIVPGAI